ncbi:flagellar filament capping protein FliD [Clostridium cylindrosporum]|uniref:Flagellar hook-associated protein 2 n=1 Tax=Clostridium cylindrosporum DSM 605 TaxID=1121307 RepID=A0A0J8G1R2_CLOCY|nr:flagellar filament capping protein FliD [Clostridium cylindrosporum]KMT21691.1 flagellar hook-associated protein 2 [Clostridium cylindrosporum DSM 605]
MVMRIGGLASGMDTDTVVKQMLSREQARVDKVKGQKQILQWQQETYRDFIGQIQKFKNKYFDQLNKATYALSNSFFSSKTSTVVGSDSGAVSITPSNTANSGTYKVDVTTVAKGAKVEATLNAKLTDSLSGVGINTGEKITIKGTGISDTVIEVKDSTKTISDLVSLINNDTNLKGNINASYSEITGKLSIETVNTGNAQELTVTDSFSNNNIKFLDSNVQNPIEGQKALGVNGNIKVTVNGGASTYTTNKFTVDGIAFNIKDIGTTPTSTTFEVSPNVDKAVDNIKEFVKTYNEMIDGIASKIYERKQYKYSPLTDEQKKEMKEDEIKSWESKCKEGIIKGDSTLEKMLLDMRQAFSTSIDGKTVKGVSINLKDIGIGTSADFTQRGKLEIDEEKLRTALKERPDDVAKLFTQESSDYPYDKKTGYGGNPNRRDNVGIFVRLSDIVEDNIGTIGGKGFLLKKAGITGDITVTQNTISDTIKEKDTLLSDLIRKMSDKEAMLYNKFATLESVMNKYNSQSSWLTQQLGGM